MRFQIQAISLLAWFFVLFQTQLHSEPASWELVWSDEFDGAEIEFSKWDVEENGHGGGNEELQYYLDRPRNLRVEKGNLVIEAHKEKVDLAGVRRDYSSGKMRTKRRASWQYGKFEIRAKLPAGRGIWPAFWMLPDEDHYGPWAASGEIDLMEMVGHEPSTVHGTLHYGGSWPRNQHAGAPFKLKEGTFGEAFHVFTVEWEKGEIRWYVDGVCYQTQRDWQSEGGKDGAPFDRPFHLILNLAVGGKWPGAPDETTVFPQRIEVDYVRVYRRK